MSLADLCAAALALSDNTAANFVLAAVGGPAGITAFFRTLGDATSRLDRTEPALNEATPGDPRDTTTPAAAAADLDKLLLGDALKPASRERLDAMDDRATRSPRRCCAPPCRRAGASPTRPAPANAARAASSRRSGRRVARRWSSPSIFADTGAAIGARNAAIARIGAALVKAVGG